MAGAAGAPLESSVRPQPGVPPPARTLLGLPGTLAGYRSPYRARAAELRRSSSSSAHIAGAASPRRLATTFSAPLAPSPRRTASTFSSAPLAPQSSHAPASSPASHASKRSAQAELYGVERRLSSELREQQRAAKLAAQLGPVWSRGGGGGSQLVSEALSGFGAGLGRPPGPIAAEVQRQAAESPALGDGAAAAAAAVRDRGWADGQAARSKEMCERREGLNELMKELMG